MNLAQFANRCDPPLYAMCRAWVLGDGFRSKSSNSPNYEEDRHEVHENCRLDGSQHDDYSQADEDSQSNAEKLAVSLERNRSSEPRSTVKRDNSHTGDGTTLMQIIEMLTQRQTAVRIV